VRTPALHQPRHQVCRGCWPAGREQTMAQVADVVLCPPRPDQHFPHLGLL